MHWPMLLLMVADEGQEMVTARRKPWVYDAVEAKGSQKPRVRTDDCFQRIFQILNETCTGH